MCPIIKNTVAATAPLHAEQLLKKERRRGNGSTRKGTAHKGCGTRWDAEDWSDKHMKKLTTQRRTAELEAGALDQLTGKRVADWEAEQRQKGMPETIIGELLFAIGGGTVFTMGDGVDAEDFESNSYSDAVNEHLAADEDDGVDYDTPFDWECGGKLSGDIRLSDEISFDDQDKVPGTGANGMFMHEVAAMQREMTLPDGSKMMAMPISGIPSVKRQTELCRGQSFGGVPHKPQPWERRAA